MKSKTRKWENILRKYAKLNLTTALVVAFISTISGAFADTSEMFRDNKITPRQPVNLSGSNVTAGHFLGDAGIQYLTVDSPKEYVNYLWGQSDPDYAAGLRMAKERGWKDTATFWELTKGSSIAKPTNRITIEGMSDFCLHNSHLVAADFNEDGIDDVLVACHGYDGPPFPGDHSYVIMSKSSGEFVSMRLTGKIGFYHNGTVFDVNNDGHLDALLTDTKSKAVVAFYGDGLGGFSKPKTLLSNLGFNYTLSSYDFNRDGLVDLFVGGHEIDRHGKNGKGIDTRIFFNMGSGKFSKKNSVVIPPSSRYGIVLDSVVHGDFLYVVRTQHYPNAYVGGAIQQIDLRNMAEINVIEKSSGNAPSRIQRVFSSGGVSFGSLDKMWNAFDFTVSADGSMRFVR